MLKAKIMHFYAVYSCVVINGSTPLLVFLSTSELHKKKIPNFATVIYTKLLLFKISQNSKGRRLFIPVTDTST